MNKRKYPDFRSCPVPVFPALGNKIKFGEVVLGMTPVPRTSYDQDPDLPTPSFGNLYKHAAMPGLLFRRVSNVSELFRLGSSFIVGRRIGASAGCTDGAIVLAGRRAEYALEGNALLSPQWNVSIPLNKNGDGVQQAVSASLSGKNRFPLLDNASVSGGGVTASDFDATKTPAVVFAGVSDVRWTPTLVSGIAYVFNGSHAITLQRSFVEGDSAAIGDLAIMALMTDADDGCLAIESTFLSGNLPITRYIGNLTKTVSIGTIGSCLSPLKTEAISSAPSQLQQHLSRAWDYEMALKKDVVLESAVGTWWHSWASANRPNGGAGVSVESGWVAPFVTNGSNCTSSAFTTYGGRELQSAATAYWMIKPAEMSEEQYNLMHCSLCWGDAKIVGQDLVPMSPVSRPSATVSATLSLHEILVQRARDMEAGFDSSRVGGIANAAGVIENAGTPSAQLVPTLDANFSCSRSVLAMYAEDPLTYGPAKEFREFYRRVYKRAEDLVRKT